MSQPVVQLHSSEKAGCTGTQRAAAGSRVGDQRHGACSHPLYLNYGSVKEEMIGTKWINSFIMHVAKLGTYTILGAIKLEYLGYTAAAGGAGIVSSRLAKRWLRRISEQWFRQMVILSMVFQWL